MTQAQGSFRASALFDRSVSRQNGRYQPVQTCAEYSQSLRFKSTSQRIWPVQIAPKESNHQKSRYRRRARALENADHEVVQSTSEWKSCMHGHSSRESCGHSRDFNVRDIVHICQLLFALGS